MRNKIKNIEDIEKYDEKLGKIRETLHNSEKPLDYREIAERTKLDKQEVFRIIGSCFIKASKETTHSGCATDDFILFGEKIVPIKNNLWYKVVKSRLKLGGKTAKHTRGHLR